MKSVAANVLRFSAFLMLIVVSSTPLRADDAYEQLESLVEPILGSIQARKRTGIFSTALEGSGIRKYFTKQQIESVDQEFEGYLADAGEHHSSSLLFESEIPETYVSRWYVLKFERQPFLLHLGFYKPENRWRVQDIQLESELDDYVKTASSVAIGAMSAGTENGLLRKTVANEELRSIHGGK